MRPVALYLVVAACVLAPLQASTVPSPISVTVLLQFEQDHSDASMKAMEKEMQSLFKTTGYHFDFKRMSDVTPSESFDDLVVVKMKGRCVMDNVPLVYDERGPLAFTHSADGQVLPFSEVECDKVRNSVQKAMTGADRVHSEQVLGRALGRVLAHEMYHIFAKTGHHGEEGVAKTALSGRQLVSDRLQFATTQLHELAIRR